MRRFIFIVILSIVTQLNSIAGNFSINGTWLLTNVKQGKKTQDIYFILNFADNNILKIKDDPIGKWKFNASEQTVSLTSTVLKELSGNYNLSITDKDNITLSNSDISMFLIKFSQESVNRENKNSNFEGSWKILAKDINITLILKLPDSFEIIEEEPGVTSRIKGDWIYNPKEDNLIFITQNSEYKGVYKISKKGESSFAVVHNKKKMKIEKLKQPEVAVERLQWKDDDFYTEDGEYKYESDINKYSFNNFEEINLVYENISKLVYSFYRLLDNNQSFETTEVSAKVNNESMDTPNIEDIFKNATQQDIETITFDEYKYIFPVNCEVFKFAGEEQIITPAGTFNCEVIEAMGDFDEKVKIWMSPEKPGIPIKIIRDLNEEPFGHYYVYELKQIIEK